jgi:MYXO-CTERM domain-containing protein
LHLRPAILGRALRVSFSISIAVAVARPATALADTLTVTNAANTGVGSLREALSRARSGDVIEFQPALAGARIDLVTPDPRTLVGGSPLIHFGPTALVVDTIAVTIDGTNAPGLQIDGASTWRVFVVINGGRLTLRNVTVQNGRALGANGGVPSGGGAGGFGGGVFVADRSALTLDGVTMLQNVARGGDGGDGVTRDRTLSGEYRCGGGGGGLVTAGLPDSGPRLSGAGGQPNGGTASVDVGHFGGEGGGGSGACVILTTGGAAVLQLGGSGGWGGGGGAGASAFVDDSTPQVRYDGGGRGGFGGGAGATGFSRFRFPFMTIMRPATATSEWGGGTAGDPCSGVFGLVGSCDPAVTGNSSLGSGGGGGGAGLGAAVFARLASVSIERSTFAGNRAIGGRGGASTFSVTTGRGLAGAGAGVGALYVLDSTATVRSSTFIRNEGGAVNAITFTTSSQLSMQNTVLAGSTAGADCKIERGGWVESRGNNVVQDPGTCTTTSTDVVRVDPMLGALGRNGGPTDTALPSPVSAVVGAGICTAGELDQRGRPRTSAPSCDVGAVELDRGRVTVVLSGAGSGTVTSDRGGISCGAACTTTRLPLPIALNLTAVPAIGSVFAGFTGSGCGASPMCNVMTTSDTSITARFDSIPVDSGVTDSDAAIDVVSDATDSDANDANDANDATIADEGVSGDAREESDATIADVGMVDSSARDDGTIDSNISNMGDSRVADTSSDSSAMDASMGGQNAGCACSTQRTSTTVRPFAMLLSLAGVLFARRRRCK